MKKITLTLATVLAIVSCQNPQQENNTNTQTETQTPNTENTRP
ncbi:hypothetical protein [Capnocytophaga sp. HP1101]